MNDNLNYRLFKIIGSNKNNMEYTLFTLTQTQRKNTNTQKDNKSHFKSLRRFSSCCVALGRKLRSLLKNEIKPLPCYRKTTHLISRACNNVTEVDR